MANFSRILLVDESNTDLSIMAEALLEREMKRCGVEVAGHVLLSAWQDHSWQQGRREINRDRHAYLLQEQVGAVICGPSHRDLCYTVRRTWNRP